MSEATHSPVSVVANVRCSDCLRHRRGRTLVAVVLNDGATNWIMWSGFHRGPDHPDRSPIMEIKLSAIVKDLTVRSQLERFKAVFPHLLWELDGQTPNDGTALQYSNCPRCAPSGDAGSIFLDVALIEGRLTQGLRVDIMTDEVVAQ